MLDKVQGRNCKPSCRAQDLEQLLDDERDIGLLLPDRPKNVQMRKANIMA